MQPYLTLVRRELAGYFVSLIGYVVMAGVLFLLALGMMMVLETLNGQPIDVSVLELFYDSPFFWLILLVACPVITMRTFALEKYSGTYETLMTTPVSDIQVVLAKFTGALTFYLVTWLPLLGYPYVLRHYSADPAAVQTGPLASVFLGIFLVGCLYVSMGVFASSLTRSQLLAAMNAFLLGIVLFLLSFLPRMIQPKPGWQSDLFNHISMFKHMEDFVRGVVDLRPIVFYLSLTVMFLFLTLKVVESRRWK